MEWPEELLELFDDPLLANIHPKLQRMTVDDRLVAKLEEISQWVEANKRIPDGEGGLRERLLLRALKSLRINNKEQLTAYDRLGLLEK
ncbi:hypothetical protein [Prevotella histicola]|jgi:hypothetical protein|uniref:hypothetical protein n=1 Tax=Prevotella histicola TaxID=470565 RepID=UPI0028E483A3|nr:hypothetical protein [Prevotella histicola]